MVRLARAGQQSFDWEVEWSGSGGGGADVRRGGCVGTVCSVATKSEGPSSPPSDAKKTTLSTIITSIGRETSALSCPFTKRPLHVCRHQGTGLPPQALTCIKACSFVLAPPCLGSPNNLWSRKVLVSWTLLCVRGP